MKMMAFYGLLIWRTDISASLMAGVTISCVRSGTEGEGRVIMHESVLCDGWSIEVRVYWGVLDLDRFGCGWG